jgi:hypothetical protein
MRDLMRRNLFSPIFFRDALYMPPFNSALALRAAPLMERLGDALALPGAGVLVVEATKELFRPVAVRRAQRRLSPAMAAQPALRGSTLSGS